MAIVILGKTICSICGEVLRPGDDVVAFPPFIPNEADPLWIFSDAAFHSTHFHQHPLANEALRRYEEFKAMTVSSRRVCMVCGRSIDTPDEYFTFGHLTSDPSDLLYRFNYRQAHRQHLAQIPELHEIRDKLKRLQLSGVWKGSAGTWLLSEIDRATVSKSASPDDPGVDN
jgi:hypothetical protein